MSWSKKSIVSNSNFPDPMDRPDDSLRTDVQSEHEESFDFRLGELKNGHCNYKLLQKIGEGGMGSVYMAEQQSPIHRRVAVKLIRVGSDSRQIVARFEAERQALALMDHQNIAKVFDFGTTDDGMPYFVMELVNGIRFTDYCDKNRLSIRERLELFLPVCQAVQHAHQKGIVHRDLKPSNVLVALYDGTPVSKVIDFGLAKAVQQQTKLTDKTMFTQFGKVVGTLQYMSPEQAEGSQIDIDTRSDIYSLGVLLYEILTGSTPLENRSVHHKALIQVLELIREKDPPKPSMRVSSEITNIDELSQRRKIAPAKLRSALRGELDWIVMKALEKDRTRRYETANGLGMDIQRYLDDLPVQAKPASSIYLLKKFVRKNSILVTSLASVFSLLAACTLVTIYFWSQAESATRLADAARIDAENAEATALDEKQKAIDSQIKIKKQKDEIKRLFDESEKAKAEAVKKAEEQKRVIDLIFDVIGSGDPLFGSIVTGYSGGFGEEPTVKDIVMRISRSELEDDRDNLDFSPHVRAQVIDRLGDINLSLGNVGDALQLHKKVAKLIDGIALPKLSEVYDDRKLNILRAKNLTSLGTLDYLYGDVDSARDRLIQSKQLYEKLESFEQQEASRDLQQTKLMLAWVHLEFEDFEQIELLTKGIIANEIGINRDKRHNLFHLQKAFARLIDSISLAKQQEIKGNSINVAIPKILFAAVSFYQYFNQQSNRVGGSRPVARIFKAALLSSVGFRKKAYSELREAHSIFENVLGKHHFMNALTLYLLASSAQQSGQIQQATRRFDELIQLFDQSLGSHHPRLGEIKVQFAKMLFLENDGPNGPDELARIKQLLESGMEIQKTAFGNHRRIGDAQYWLGRVQASEKSFVRASESFENALESNLKYLENDCLKLVANQCWLAYCYLELRQLSQAQNLAKDVLRNLRKRKPLAAGERSLSAIVQFVDSRAKFLRGEIGGKQHLTEVKELQDSIEQTSRYSDVNDRMQDIRSQLELEAQKKPERESPGS